MEPVPSEPRYEISLWKDDYRSALLRQPWSSLLDTRQSSSAIYQSPKYFDYLADRKTGGRLEVLTVTNRRTAAIVGVVPLKLWTYRLQFEFRARTILGVGRECIGILGSEPLVPDDPQALDELFLAFAQRFPESQVIHMDVVPSNSYLWKHVRSSPAIRRLYRPLIVEGFRESHSVPLPESIEEYHKKLPRKKRYNLMRQGRMLQSHCGHPLQLLTITGEKDLPHLFEAIDKLPAREKYKFVFREEEYIHLARHGILQCYVLKSGERIIALLLAIRAGKVFKIDRLVHDPALERFSPGTTLWQRVLEDLITGGKFTSADFGYGLPAYRFRATNVIEHKGRILLFRRSIANCCLILAYSCYSRALSFLRTKIGRASRLDAA